MQREFTAIYQKRGKWYLGWIEEVPGVNTQGKTAKEVKENLREALRLVLDVNASLVKQYSRGHKVSRESLRLTV